MRSFSGIMIILLVAMLSFSSCERGTYHSHWIGRGAGTGKRMKGPVYNIFWGHREISGRGKRRYYERHYVKRYTRRHSYRLTRSR